MDKPAAIYNSPAHLSQESWVEFEHRAALNLLGALEGELKKLKLRVTPERVHKSRVSLRRWFSVWSFLADDGWEEKKFKKKVLTPLRVFLKELGELRDFDVNIETAEHLSCDEETMEDLKACRKRLKQRIDKSLSELDPEEVIARIENYMESKAADLDEIIKAEPNKDHSAFAHFDRYIQTHEEQVKKLSEKATCSESLHKLRLAIKKWRYLLTECMGLTNLELVRAQTLLGEIHDYDRLEPFLEEHDDHSTALAALRLERNTRIQEFEQLKVFLPFGLRPGTITYAYQSESNA